MTTYDTPVRTIPDPYLDPRHGDESVGGGRHPMGILAWVLIVARHEQGSLRSPVIKKGLWLNAPVSPRTGKPTRRPPRRTCVETCPHITPPLLTEGVTNTTRPSSGSRTGRNLRP
jgi:hypothetical protein